MIKYTETQVTFSEVPEEISLCINISNCPHKCKGCHSPHLQEDVGNELTTEVLDKLIESNKGITCVCFMGEGNNPKEIDLLACHIKLKYESLKIGLYTGNVKVPEYIDINNFDYIKLGPYIKEKGPLNNQNTNQKMYKVLFGELVDSTYLFWNIKEEWIPIKGYESLYLVSNLGNVKSLKSDKILSPSKTDRGYQLVQLYDNGKKTVKSIHRLVAEAFLNGFTDECIVNHKDNNPSNNIVYNLEICTSYYNNHYLSANIRHAITRTNNYNKPILQYSLDGNFIKEWHSFRDIPKTICKSQQNILTACKGFYYKNGIKYEVKSCCGYIWKFK